MTKVTFRGRICATVVKEYLTTVAQIFYRSIGFEIKRGNPR